MRVHQISAAAAIATLVAASLVAAVASWSAADDRAEERYSRAVLRAEDLDRRIDAEVGRAWLGLVGHYDDLVRVTDLVRTNLDVLRDPPQGARVRDEADRLVAAQEEKLAVVERFKTEHAVLRNSMRLVPHLAQRLGVGVDAVLTATVDPTPDRRERALAQIREIEAGDDPDLQALARHAGLVVERAPRVAGMLQALGAPAVTDRARDLVLAWDAARQEATTRRARWQVASVGALAIALLLVAVAVIVRLERARQHEAELALLRSRFVAMASHEFRSPLSVILSSTQLVGRYGDRWGPERRAVHLDRIATAVHDMREMLDRVLVVGRGDTTPLKHQPTPTGIGPLLEAAASEVRSASGDTHPVEIVDRSAGAVAVLDERQIRHALVNLLSNAVKYSPVGSPVRLEASVADARLRLEVADHGIGIPAGEVAQLFEPFHRCSNAAGFDGTGLGLAMVKAWVDAHRGAIAVDTAVGRGTRFRLELPMEAP